MGGYDLISGHSPFTQSIQKELLPTNFQFRMFGGIRLVHHDLQSPNVVILDIKHLDVLGVLNNIKGSLSVSSFSQLAKEFELQFLANIHLRPLAAMLLKLRQREYELLSHFIFGFTHEIRGVQDAHPSLATSNHPRNALKDELMYCCKGHDLQSTQGAP
ncbi:hypothetical protein C4D60_Mb11t03580 [Musa balbisiana]|uniref:Uncharacterized protein n=1 Tax=Musa balbisiana TaxID=52838 RepID=A0A4S8J1L2_MUSBA|nr:hypothetical protein C4D60_Mb11t03580 [Musa balbisiana]